jgi:ornithine carbamoyltransferase
VGAALIGMDIRLCGPKSLWPSVDLVTQCRTLAEGTGARITLTEDLTTGMDGCDFVYTDVWVSMGEPEDVWAERIALLSPYSVTQRVMDLTGNPHSKFLHCLPAFHNRDTKIGEATFQTYGIDCMEVSDEVFESPASVVFDQAENRLHSIKAVLVATMGAN